MVVGAGFAGLTAARPIQQAGRRCSCSRPATASAAALNHELGGGEVSERGATFVGPTQDHILALAQRVRRRHVPHLRRRRQRLPQRRRPLTYSDKGPTGTAPPDPLILPELTDVVAQLDQMSTEVPVDAPVDRAERRGVGRPDAGDVGRRHSATPRSALVPVATRPIFGAEPRELSLLFTLFYIAASGNETNPGTFERNFNTRDGAQMSRFLGGSQAIALKLAEQLGCARRAQHAGAADPQSASGVTVRSDHPDVRPSA